MPSRVIRSNYRRELIRQTEVVKRELAQTAFGLGQELQQYKTDVVRTWKNKPRFVTVIDITDNRITVLVDTKGDAKDIWRYVDEGTGKAAGNRSDDYPIRPKAPGYPLRFQRGYNARTQPVAAYDVGDGSRSGDWVATYEVRHPGITPREFTKQARRNLQRTFRREIENAIRRGIRRARS